MLFVRHGKRRKVFVIFIFALVYLCFQVFLYKKPEAAGKNTLLKNDKKHIFDLTAESRYFPNISGSDAFQSRAVIYNRLPKCASTITRLVIARLHSTYPDRFQLRIENYPRIKQVLDTDEQKQLIDKWSTISTTPTVFIRHVRFIDFEKFGHPSPIYFNMIRDPVEQFISAYYFNRFGFVGWSEAKVKKWLSLKSEKERFESLEACVTKNVTKCVERNPSRYFSYFCGHETSCNDKDRWSLEKAIKNVNQHYAVVGIAEEYEKSLWLLESYIPNYFQDITTTYINAKQKGSFPVTKTARKTNPPDEIKEKLRQALQLRVEFYQFAYKRFQRQLRDLNER